MTSPTSSESLASTVGLEAGFYTAADLRAFDTPDGNQEVGTPGTQDVIDMEDIPDGPMATAMEVSDQEHNPSVPQALGSHAETINSSAQSSLGELPPQISMAVPKAIGTTILGVGPVGTDALRTDASLVPEGTHIGPLSPFNEPSAPTVPALPTDAEMSGGTPEGTQAPWTPPDFTMDPADIPVVSPSADGTQSAEEEQGFVQDDEGMVTPEEEADFASQPDDVGMESEGEPEPNDECAASPQPVPSPPVTTEAAAAKAWAEKIDSDPRDVRAKSSGDTQVPTLKGGTQIPTLKRPMLKVPHRPEPEGEPGTPREPPAKKAGSGRGGGRPKSPPPPFRKAPPPEFPEEVPLPDGIPPIEPLSATAEMALRCAWGAIEDGTAHSHNFLLACYYLFNHRTGGNLNNINTPHP
eukprot:1862450-Amphidinium_carterae.1